MNAEKIRILTDEELRLQQQQATEELHKLKFQLRMGQTESVKKLRELKKDVARFATIVREKSLAAAKENK